MKTTTTLVALALLGCFALASEAEDARSKRSLILGDYYYAGGVYPVDPYATPAITTPIVARASPFIGEPQFAYRTARVYNPWPSYYAVNPAWPYLYR